MRKFSLLFLSLFAVLGFQMAQAQNVAKIGDTEYASLQEAIMACPTDGSETTITLLADVANGTGFQLPDGTKGRNVIINFGKHTYTVADGLVGSTGTATQAMHFASGNTITLKNGTINVKADLVDSNTGKLCKMMMQNYANLTIEGMTIDCTNVTPDTYGTYTGQYAFWSNKTVPVFNFLNNSVSTIKTSTITFREGDDWGIIVDDNSSLTITGKTINGNVSNVSDNASITITGGTYNGDVKNIGNGTIAITGGTFKGEFPEESVDAAVKHTDVNGNVKFLALSGTFISSSGTYQLLKDGSLTVRLAPGIFARNVTLDLNGHTLTSTASDFAFLLTRAGSETSHYTFDLVNTAEGTTGTLAVAASATAIQAQGKYSDITIGKNVVISSGSVTLMSENQTLNVEGTINGGNDFAIATNGATTKNATINIKDGAVLTSNVTAVYLPGTGTTTVEDGATITGATGIYIKSGNLNITGGTINGTGAREAYTYNGNGANSTGNALVIDNCGYPGGAPVVNITGGMFNSTNNEAVGSYAYGEGNEPIGKFISGGSFSSQVPAEFCAEGYEPTEILPNGKYGVRIEQNITLSETADNSTMLNNLNGLTRDVTIGRSFVNTSYQTLSLPFDLTQAQIEDVFGVSTRVLTFTGAATDAEKNIVLNFTGATGIEAGKPYLILPFNNVENPTFTGVTVSNAAAQTVTGEQADFIANINATEYAANEQQMYLGADNKLYFNNTTATMKGFRAYFMLKGTTPGKTVGFSFDGTPTGITTITGNDNGNVNVNGWYTLDGQKLNAAPTQKGVYINNGRKVVVK